MKKYLLKERISETEILSRELVKKMEIFISSYSPVQDL